MTKLPQMTGEACIRALKRAGFHVDRHKGSHVILLGEPPRARAVVPVHKVIKKGALHQIFLSRITYHARASRSYTFFTPMTGNLQ
ncbi:MAG: type II toxin-antitoxin system HicA family toxin [Deltaproteobacteria bacterium]|nr:type II toxin-antitoxin system HicA family toxin [Deltaproteobacteria bacterium]